MMTAYTTLNFDELSLDNFDSFLNNVKGQKMFDKLELKSVVSSNISNIGFDKSRQILFIMFNNAPEKVFAYYDVDETIFDSLSSAQSIGKAFYQLLKGKFEFCDYSIDDCKEQHGIDLVIN